MPWCLEFKYTTPASSSMFLARSDANADDESNSLAVKLPWALGKMVPSDQLTWQTWNQVTQVSWDFEELGIPFPSSPGNVFAIGHDLSIPGPTWNIDRLENSVRRGGTRSTDGGLEGGQSRGSEGQPWCEADRDGVNFKDFQGPAARASRLSEDGLPHPVVRTDRQGRGVKPTASAPAPERGATVDRARLEVGSLAGLGTGLIALPIMMDEFTLFFWLTLGLALGGGVGFVHDILAGNSAQSASEPNQQAGEV